MRLDVADGHELSQSSTVSSAPSAQHDTPLDRWDQLWGSPAGPPPLPWHRIERASRRLAEAVPCSDLSGTFEHLVGSEELRSEPLHRWFTYKEGYSPRLLDAVITQLKLDDGLHVADVFGGVATTALAGQVHPKVAEVRSLEYSPWAHFAGTTKLSWTSLDPMRLRALLPSGLDFSADPHLSFPHLAAFENPRIFDPETVMKMLSAREHLAELPGATAAERAFLLLGLGAVVEDLSNAIKDGRALRIISGRKRRASSFALHRPAVSARGRVKRALAGQWTAMIEDLESCAGRRELALATPVAHVKGDARQPIAARLADETDAFPDNWAQLSCFSPPYLNCIDYTEVYKLELWLMQHVSTQDEFREIRLGTLRSHPSVRFPHRGYFEGMKHPVIDLVKEISMWVSDQGGRREVGPVVAEYFEDMMQVWREQARLLASGGVAVCVVANSTFSRRERDSSKTLKEHWRMPLLTDVILAHLATLAGFEDVEIWKARELRPRNVRGGSARESLVVARKP
jgi:hypothetical protein